MSAWKDLERRVCAALGGRRAGPIGAAVSDCVGVPFSVECKRSSRIGPPVLAKWVLQAREQGRREDKPWLLVVAGHRDRKPIVTLEFHTLVAILDLAGLLDGSGKIALPSARQGTTGDDGSTIAAEGQP